MKSIVITNHVLERFEERYSNRGSLKIVEMILKNNAWREYKGKENCFKIGGMKWIIKEFDTHFLVVTFLGKINESKPEIAPKKIGSEYFWLKGSRISRTKLQNKIRSSNSMKDKFLPDEDFDENEEEAFG